MRARAIVAAGFVVLVLLIGGATTAQADTYPVPPPPSILPIAQSPAAAPAAVAARETSRGLALTGADIIGMVMLGAGLVAIGFVVRQAGRRSPAV